MADKDLDIELTDDDIAIIKLALSVFGGMMLDLRTEDGTGRIDKAMKNLKEHTGLDEDADLVILTAATLGKFFDEEELAAPKPRPDEQVAQAHPDDPPWAEPEW